MSKGLNLNGRQEIASMVTNHASGPAIRERIEEIEVVYGDYNYEANEAICRKLEVEGYGQTASFLRKKINDR